MGRFGDWAKGPWKDTIRVKVAYVVEKPNGESTRYEIITVIPKKSLRPRRDAAERVTMKLSQTVKPPDLFRVVSTTIEGDVPLIHPKDSW
jgi:hypothetical protein